MGCVSLLSFVLFVGLVLAESEDSKVLQLTSDNFNETIEKNDYVLVKFYAPWCGHCKKLEPEYVMAADNMAKVNPAVILAKVDATQETDLANRFEVRGYPTLKFFKFGSEVNYEGDRTAQGIVAWLTKKTGPPVNDVDTAADFDQLKKDNEFMVVALSKDTSSDEWKKVEEIASSLDYVFVRPTHQSVLDQFEHKDGVKIVLVKQFDEASVVYDGKLDVEEVKNFIKMHAIPLVVEFNDENAAKVFGSDLKRHILAFMSSKEDHYKPNMETLNSVALKFRGKVHVVVVDTSNNAHDRILEFFGIDQEKDVPTYRVIKLDDGLQKFKPKTDNFDSEIIATFFVDVENGKIKEHLRSDPIPEDWDKEDVKVLVGENFKDVVNAEGKAVFVEVYAPWCGHCKQLEPIWKKLGEVYRDSADVVIAKMDGTTNEVEDFKVGSFPTLKFFPKGSDEAEDYSGDRSIEAFISFLEKKGHPAPADATKDEKVKEEL